MVFLRNTVTTDEVVGVLEKIKFIKEKNESASEDCVQKCNEKMHLLIFLPPVFHWAMYRDRYP